MVGLDQTAEVRPRNNGFSWPLMIGLGALSVPAALSLGSEIWSSDAGAHGPLVIAIAAWLLWLERSQLQILGRPGNAWVVCFALIPALCMYIAGEAFDFITLEALGLYIVVVAVFYSLFGAREIARNWFHLRLYLTVRCAAAAVVAGWGDVSAETVCLVAGRLIAAALWLAGQSPRRCAIRRAVSVPGGGCLFGPELHHMRLIAISLLYIFIWPGVQFVALRPNSLPH